jgi:heavy metal sensor kinase
MSSIRHRFFVGFVLLLAAALAVYGLLFYSAIREWLAPDALAMAKDKTVRLGRWVKPDPVAHDPYLDTIIRNEIQGYHWAVLDANGHPIQKSRLLPEVFPLPEGALAVQYELVDAHAELRRGTNGALYAVAWYPLLVINQETMRARTTGWTEAVVPLQPFLERKARLGRWLLATGIAALAAFSTLAYYLCSQWLRPWRTAADAAERLSTGDLAEGRLPGTSDDADLARIVESFNTLLDRLKALHLRQEQFVADAAHELRTPLTALRAEIEVALRRHRSGGEYQQTLELNRLELERLSTLVENLLALTRLDTSGSPLDRSPANLAAICREVTEQLAPLARAQSVSLNLDVPDELVVNGDALGLERAVRNLVENAIRHTPAGEEIVIRAGAENSEARIAVIDHGVGIASEHLPRLFDRFYRVDTARNRALGGAGLGLSIVKAIAVAHGGSAEVQSELGKGSTFTIRLPRPSLRN